MLFLNDAQIIKAAMRRKGYVVFGNDVKGYDLNLVGIRTRDTRANKFNDHLVVMWLWDGQWNLFAFPATTDPGVYWRNNPMRVEGTAVLVPGQYRGAYQIGEHKSYPALVQRKDVKVYRDDNRDDVLDLDPTTIQEGMFGINIHRASASKPSTTVDKWSAGCQVLQDPLQQAFLMELARKSAELFGNAFTYTLLTEDDFDAA